MSGRSCWDPVTERQILARRSVGKRDGEGCYSSWSWPGSSLLVACGQRLDCGGTCLLAVTHRGNVPCECIGDQPGDPGSCPA